MYSMVRTTDIEKNTLQQFINRVQWRQQSESVKAQDSKVTTGHSCLLQWQHSWYPVSEQKQPRFQVYLTETGSV